MLTFMEAKNWSNTSEVSNFINLNFEGEECLSFGAFGRVLEYLDLYPKIDTSEEAKFDTWLEELNQTIPVRQANLTIEELKSKIVLLEDEVETYRHDR